MGNEKICENESEEITVSVVMPVYNGEKYLNQAIESVLLQRKEISSIELLIVDDASTDSTPEIIKKYQKENPPACAENGHDDPCHVDLRQGNRQNDYSFRRRSQPGAHWHRSIDPLGAGADTRKCTGNDFTAALLQL